MIPIRAFLVKSYLNFGTVISNIIVKNIIMILIENTKAHYGKFSLFKFIKLKY